MLLDTDDNAVVLELTDDGGETRRYDLLDMVEYEGGAYGVFLPEGQDDGEVRILRLTGKDMQKAENYAPVHEPGLEQAVFDFFQIKNLDAFDFGANAFGGDGVL